MTFERAAFSPGGSKSSIQFRLNSVADPIQRWKIHFAAVTGVGRRN